MLALSQTPYFMIFGFGTRGLGIGAHHRGHEALRRPKKCRGMTKLIIEPEAERRLAKVSR